MNQLLLDLSALKAEVLLDWGKGSYCHCLVGKMAKVTGVEIINSQEIGILNERFKHLGRELSRTAEPELTPYWDNLLEWNDANERTRADVVRLVQDTFDRESRR